MRVALIYQGSNAPWRRHTELYMNDCRQAQDIKRILTQKGIVASIWDSIDSYLENRPGRDTKDELAFSLIENCFERNRAALVPAIWELMGIPYVGNDAYAFTITADKLLFQDQCQKLGLKCPRSFEISSDMSTEAIQCSILANHFDYPLILKYRYGSMSHGLAMVHNLEALLSETKRLLANEPDSSILCQEYIPGIEATVPIVGTGESAHALALVQYAAPGQKPLHLYNKEWKFELDHLVDLISFPSEDAFTQKVLNDCLALHRHLGLLDVSRVDLRITAEKQVYILEANCLPSLGYGGAFDTVCYGGTQSFDDIILEIVQSARSRNVKGDENNGSRCNS